MRRVLTLPVALVATAMAALAADEPPPDDSDVSFDVEPPLLIPNRSDEPLPASAVATPVQDVDLARLEKDFQRAKRNATGVQRFCKIGALSKVEAEQRALRAIRLESDLANARLTQAKEELLQKEKQLAAGEISKKDLAETESALALAIEAAHATAAKRERAELEAAEANVHRQEKLLALGSARKSDVSRAEQRLAELKAQKN
jgi:septal ring factor EnvC (AmiA/AmiB activator)